MIIEQAIKLKDALDSYHYKITRPTHEADRNYVLDEITSDDWETLIKIKSILKLFHVTTKHLESNAIKRSHGALWKVVIGLKCLIQSLQEQHIQLIHDVETKKLALSVSLALDKLEEYLRKTNRSAV